MSMPGLILLTVISCVGAGANVSSPESHQFKVVSWNVDASGADPQAIALRISQFQGVAIWGLCNVRDSRSAEWFAQAAGENEPGDFVGILSRTEGSDQSCIIYDKSQFDLIKSYEIDWKSRFWYCAGTPVRPPLVAHLRHRATRQEFSFIVNRLYGYRIDAQATDLNAWAGGRLFPVIAVGTYDFQYDPDTGPLCPEGQKALLALIANGVFRWLPPDNPVATFNWDRDVIDDFIFLANTLGKVWGHCSIVVEPGDFSSSEMTSNHRPVQAVFTVGSPPPVSSMSTRLQRAGLSEAP